MKFNPILTLMVSGFLVASMASVTWAKPPRMKMTTDIPASIPIADKVETRLSTLRFNDGFPDEATAQKVYDQMDFQRAVEAMMMTMPGASLHGFRKGLREWGPDNVTAAIWEKRMDSKVILLTPNTTVVYLLYVVGYQRRPTGSGNATECAGYY